MLRLRFLIFLQLFAISLVVAAKFPQPVINLSLLQTLKSKGTANVIIRMSAGNQEPLVQIKQTKFADRGSRLSAVTNSLKLHAAQSQSSLLTFLATIDDLKYESLWISNEIAITGASLQVIEHIAAFIETTLIAEIHEEIIAPLLGLETSPATPRSEIFEIPDNLKKIEADRVWEELQIDGKGAIVATIDTGVRGTHETLRNNFVGNYGWYDPGAGSLVPHDDIGQGTMVTGMMVGRFDIGVAPGAKWMACKGCEGFGCTQIDLTKCAQYMVCPFLADGSAPDCSKAPHVVNNVWGGPTDTPWFDGSIQAMIAAGVTPVFGVGTQGPNCGSVVYPASSNAGVISIAVSSLDDVLSPNSAHGPTAQGTIKPDATCPGSARSASAQGDFEYVNIQGALVAASHGSGVIGLLKGLSVDLPDEEVKKFALEYADRTVVTQGRNCGGISETVYPNNAAGWGRLNAYKAVVALQGSKKL